MPKIRNESITIHHLPSGLLTPKSDVDVDEAEALEWAKAVGFAAHVVAGTLSTDSDAVKKACATTIAEHQAGAKKGRKSADDEGPRASVAGLSAAGELTADDYAAIGEEDALDLIKAETDPRALATWRVAEKRAKLQKALDKRITEIRGKQG